MPVSVYIFLVASLFAFLPAYFDHGKTWGEIKEEKGRRKKLSVLKLFVLWAIPISGLVGTVFLAVESVKSEKEDSKRESQFRDVTNELGQIEFKYYEATNALELAKQAAIDAKKSALEAAEIDAKNVARIITPENRASIINALKQSPKGVVGVYIFMGGGPEATSFAGQIKLLLNDAGFDTGTQLGFTSLNGPVPRGVIIAMDDINLPPPYTGPIFNAFKSTGLKMSVITKPNKKDKTPLIIFVGEKP